MDEYEDEEDKSEREQEYRDWLLQLEQVYGVKLNEGEVISPKQFTKIMLIVSAIDDPEERHVEFDNIMERVLRQLGYGEGINLMDNLTIWYA